MAILMMVLAGAAVAVRVTLPKGKPEDLVFDEPASVGEL